MSIAMATPTPTPAGSASPTGGVSAHELAFGPGSVRQYPLKVIVCGLGRTGTTSIQQALGILGFPTYHAQQVWAAPTSHVAMWNRAMAAKYMPSSDEKPLTRQEWDELLGQHMGVVDVPAAWFGPELAELYPSAKVIVTTRDKKAWFRSCVAAFQHRKLTAGWFMHAVFKTIFFWDARMLELFRFMDRKQEDVWKFEWFEDGAEEKAIKAYDKYYDEVRERIPESKRIEFTVQDGWGPLCEHLGVEVPTTVVAGETVELPFPRSNDAEAFLAMVAKKRSGAFVEALKDWVVRIGWVSAGTYILFPHARRLLLEGTRAWSRMRP